MKPDPKIHLSFILECIELLQRYTKGLTKEDFLGKPQIQDAVMRRIELVGEAVKNLPDSLKKQHSDVRWRESAGMRDILVHNYFGVDLNITWEVVEKSLPELKSAITRILCEMGESEGVGQ